MPWLTRLVGGLSPRISGLNLSTFHVEFAVDKVTLRQVSLRELRFSLLIIIPSMLHIPNTDEIGRICSMHGDITAYRTSFENTNRTKRIILKRTLKGQGSAGLD